MCTQLHTARLAPEAVTDSARYAWLPQESSRTMEYLTVANRTAHQRGYSDPSISMSLRRELDEDVQSSERRHQKSSDQHHSDCSESLREVETHSKALSKYASNSTADSIMRETHLNKPLHQSARSITSAGDLIPALALNRVTSLEQLQPSDSSLPPAQTKSSLKHEVSAGLDISAQALRSLSVPDYQSNFESRILEDFKSSAAFASDQSYIQVRRNDHMSLQSQIRGMRSILRDKQSAKSVLEDKLFQRVLRQELGVPSSKHKDGIERESTLELIQKYQVARDDYGPLQDDCDQLEEQLYTDSYELNRLETEFFAKWTVHSVSSIKQESSIKPEGSTSDEADYGEEDEDFTYHPLVSKYLSKLGDLDIAQERLDEILDEIEQLEEQKLTRGKFGLSLGTEEQSWLDDSERLQNEVEEQIAVLAAEVEILKQQCLSQGLLDEDGDPIDIKAQEQERFGQEDGLDPGSHVSEYIKHPILLQQPGATSDSGSDYIPDLGESSYTVRGRINNWLLDRLRTSALDVSLLAWTYEKDGGETSNGWQKSVLECWYDDGTLSSLADFNAHTFSMYHSAQSTTDQKSPAIVRSSFELDSDKSEYGTERTIQAPSSPGHLAEKTAISSA